MTSSLNSLANSTCTLTKINGPKLNLDTIFFETNLHQTGGDGMTLLQRLAPYLNLCGGNLFALAKSPEGKAEAKKLSTFDRNIKRFQQGSEKLSSHGSEVLNCLAHILARHFMNEGTIEPRWLNYANFIEQTIPGTVYRPLLEFGKEQKSYAREFRPVRMIDLLDTTNFATLANLNYAKAYELMGTLDITASRQLVDAGSRIDSARRLQYWGAGIMAAGGLLSTLSNIAPNFSLLSGTVVAAGVSTFGIGTLRAAQWGKQIGILRTTQNDLATAENTNPYDLLIRT